LFCKTDSPEREFPAWVLFRVCAVSISLGVLMRQNYPCVETQRTGDGGEVASLMHLLGRKIPSTRCC
jgi:hypothetical protein